MPHRDLEDNFRMLIALIKPLLEEKNNTDIEKMISHCIERNLYFLNDVITLNITHFKNLQKITSVNDIICMQARFSHEVTKKIETTAQQLFQTTMNPLVDYNEWLKTHCDLATD